MPELIVLGSAASVPDALHDTVALALRGPDWAVLVECGGSSLHKLAAYGVAMEAIRAVILTHRHADHIYGLPMFIQGLWLAGRVEPLPIYGPAQTLAVARDLLDLFTLLDREGVFPLEWHPVPMREGRRVLAMGGVVISASPAVHGSVDSLALRFDAGAGGRAIVYSSDTEPCPAVARLAAGADLLLHEATGEYEGHSSPADAAEIAREAGVGELALIHYPVLGVRATTWLSRASAFSGPVRLAQDGDIFPL